MGLIINDKIPMFKTGYPTMSDKYNVVGGMLEGTSNAVEFGDLVAYGATAGYYKSAVGASAITDIAGFTLATNVKVASTYPATSVKIEAGEAFNLVLGGNSYLAIKLDSAATEAQVKAGSAVEVILATGKCTTSDKHSAGTIDTLPGVVFTGVYEIHGSDIVAEIIVK